MGLRLLVHRPADTSEFHSLVRLLSRSFRLDEIGHWAYANRWPAAAVQFSYFLADSCIANVGALQMQMRIAGRDVCVGGIHAVATDAAYRGRGLFTDLMDRAIDHLSGTCETILLFTREPSLYQRSGFRVVHDDVFLMRRGRAQCDPVRPQPAIRAMDLAHGFEAATITRLHKDRAPVSEVFAPLDRPPWFWGNALQPGIEVRLLIDCNAAVVVQSAAGRTRLLDIIGPALPPIDLILHAVAPQATDVELWFTPDRFPQLDCEVLPRRDGDFLLARGPLAVEGRAFAFPPTAYF